MEHKIIDHQGKQVIIRAAGHTCASKHEILNSTVLRRILFLYFGHLKKTGSPLVEQMAHECKEAEDLDELILFFRILGDFPIEEAANLVPMAKQFVDKAGRKTLMEFVEGQPLDQVGRRLPVPDLGVAQLELVDRGAHASPAAANDSLTDSIPRARFSAYGVAQ